MVKIIKVQHLHKLVIAYQKSTCLTRSCHHQVALFQTHVPKNIGTVHTYIWKTDLFDGLIHLKYISVLLVKVNVVF